MDDKVKEIEEYMKKVMEILEIPITKSNQETPYRLAKMWCNELFLNRNNSNIEELNEKMKLFPNEYTNDLIIIKDIDFHSICEHHWLPFSGKITVGYLPNLDIIGLSKIPRVVKYFSQKPQLQEKLTYEIGDYLFNILRPHALFIEVTATHQCVVCRGIENNCNTKTYYKFNSHGFENTWEEFKNRI